ncbi:MAG: DUF2892 domain-containing protein, partial [Thermoanaerobaculia bacterium]|nr:DUF2892 domain-containing protein [Thermoanaerobaculia bacterium]
DKRNSIEIARFMASPAGRGIRILTGLTMISAGIAKRDGAGAALAVFGLVPLFAGTLNICVLAPLLDVPFSGEDVP